VKVMWGVMLAGLMLMAAPQQRANAMPLVGASGLAAASAASDGLTIEVRGRYGGGGRHGGRFFHRGGGRFFAPAYYGGGPRCRWVETVYGPRRICRRGPWW
jgi:hypothetical protein